MRGRNRIFSRRLYLSIIPLQPPPQILRHVFRDETVGLGIAQNGCHALIRSNDYEARIGTEDVEILEGVSAVMSVKCTVWPALTFLLKKVSATLCAVSRLTVWATTPLESTATTKQISHHLLLLSLALIMLCFSWV